MQNQPDLSFVGGLIGDPARAAMLSALLSGQSLPASDLAYRAHITAQTASAHLAKLVDGGLLEVQQIGRHRYYRLKNVEVARALEALAIIAPPPRTKSHQESEAYQELCFARTCYDHLAGKVGVALTQALVNNGWMILEGQSFALTEQGTSWLATWELNPDQLRQGRRAFARTCLDWSERRDHLAGALGAALTTKLFEKGWIARIGDTRSVRLTDKGRTDFSREFDVKLL